MKLIQETIDISAVAQSYYNSRIKSRFDKWLSYDFGGIRGYAFGETNVNDEDDWIKYHETWNYVGRQPNNKYTWLCTDSYDKSQIGKILQFDRFNDVAKYIALPDRGRY